MQDEEELGEFAGIMGAAMVGRCQQVGFTCCCPEPSKLRLNTCSSFPHSDGCRLAFKGFPPKAGPHALC